jgi:hypothetical protein
MRDAGKCQAVQQPLPGLVAGFLFDSEAGQTGLACFFEIESEQYAIGAGIGFYPKGVLRIFLQFSHGVLPDEC